VQALRTVEPYLGLEKLYVMGTNCTDNGPREGLEKFLNAASDTPGGLGLEGLRVLELIV
jgi:7-hydroxymethyl chlorophyll a reductase